MKKRASLITGGAAVLIAATLSLQAQTPPSPSTPESRPASTESTKNQQPQSPGTASASVPSNQPAEPVDTPYSSHSKSQSAGKAEHQASEQNSPPSDAATTATNQQRQPAPGESQTADPALKAQEHTEGRTASNETEIRSEAGASASLGTARSTPDHQAATQSDIRASTDGAPALSHTSTTTTGSVAATTQAETEVQTFVQEIDAGGPVVVERITTQFADVACSPENVQVLLDGLRNGTAVTLTADGKTATFNPAVNLGYGEAYLTLALAAEALRAAGVSGCATPDQWQAVLMGGPLAAAGTTTTSTSQSVSASSTSNFPGILALRSQGQGWGQIAQSSNVQLGQVVSNARSSLSFDARSESALTPTGRSSQEFHPPSGPTPPQNENGKSPNQPRDEDREEQDDDRPDGAETTPTLPTPPSPQP